MPDRLVPFGSLLRYPLRSGVTVAKDARGQGIRMVNMRELFRFPRLGDVEMERVSIDTTNEDRFLLRRGDLLFARRSLTAEGAGRCALVVDDREETTWESSIIRARLDPGVAVPEYFYYLFSSPPGRRSVEAITEQVAAAGIRSSDLAALLVPLPPVSRQRAVAEVLGALDEKIAVNDRIVTTAFDVATARYQELGSRAARRVRLGDLLDLAYGRALPAGLRVSAGDVPVYGSSGKIGTHGEALVPGPGIVVGRKGTVGAVYWSEQDFYPIDTTFYVKQLQAGVPLEFLFFALRGLGLDAMNSDSAVPGLNRGTALASQVRLPAAEDIDGFSRTARTLFALRHALEAESASLARLKEALLPGLVSGEIPIRHHRVTPLPRYGQWRHTILKVPRIPDSPAPLITRLTASRPQLPNNS